MYPRLFSTPAFCGSITSALRYKGPPDVNRLAVSYAVVFVAGVLRARRHHARDGKRLGIERDLPPDDVGIGGKTVAPQPVAQNRLLSVAGDLVVGVELMPARGVQSQHVEKPGSHLEACEALRLAGAGKLQIGARETGQGFEGTIARAKIAKVERVQRKLGVAGAVEEYAHDTVGLGIGKRPQQHAVDDAEDGAIRADGERQREHNHHGEAGVLAQRAQRVSQVAPKVFDVIGASHIAAFLLNLRHAAQLAERGAARFGGRHARGEILFHLLFKMEAQFLVEIFFHALPARQGAQPHPDDIPPPQHGVIPHGVTPRPCGSPVPRLSTGAPTAPAPSQAARDRPWSDRRTWLRARSRSSAMRRGSNPAAPDDAAPDTARPG